MNGWLKSKLLSDTLHLGCKGLDFVVVKRVVLVVILVVAVVYTEE